MPRAERPIVVSLNKSGTNLVARLVRALGYEPLGEGIRESYPELERLARRVENYPFEGAGALLPLLLREAPADCALFFHLLPTGPHLGEWVYHRAPPPILYHYRDPRGLVVSLVHYLTGKAREGFTSVPWYEAQAQALAGLTTTAARIDHAISHFGDFLDMAYRQHAWLLRHPAVHRSSYERLVGAAGGGSAEEQRRLVSSLMLHFGVSGEPADVSRQLYATDSRTFRKGHADGWRDEFSPTQLAAFRDRYGDILDLYGYE